MSWKVSKIVRRKAFYKGDLSSTEDVEDVTVYKTKKDAIAWAKRQCSGYKCQERISTKDPSFIWYYDGSTWTDENTGEKIEGRVCFKIQKA